MSQDSMLEIAGFSPKSLQCPNAWVGHLPFAAWVIHEVSPKIFVELGTHSGNSYFTFCQTVVEKGLIAKCYAVDTWQGDEHAGQYGDEIFIRVNEHHQEHYAGFSQLLRMTFDDAATYFAGESIDLLHIDGLHTYEAVRHDFETWLPKLTPGAVVMFHDTNVRERNFGVWKLWEELQASYPNNLEFVHSHGLGVLQLNNAPDDKILRWLQPNSPKKNQLISYFAALGARQFERYELNELTLHVADRDKQIETLNQAVDERDKQIETLNQAVDERDKQITNLRDEVNHILIDNNSEIRCLQKQLNEILLSRSWRITSPLRTIQQVVRLPKVTYSERIADFLRLRRKLIRGSAIDMAVDVAVDTIKKSGLFNKALIDAAVEVIKKSGLFDESFYRTMYTDIQPPSCDAVRHYCERGWREGKNPSDDFDTNFYLSTYNDIRNSGTNPFWHYIVAGAAEMRQAAPFRPRTTRMIFGLVS